MAIDGDEIQNYAERLLKGERRALAQALTLVESSRSDDQDKLAKLLALLPPPSQDTQRLAITGPPGAGKSCLIEKIGLHYIQKGHKVGVLAIDPTSPLSGGALMGDKTRMAQLAINEKAFIRPAPSGKGAGGIHNDSREVIWLMEVAGYDFIMLETVGVGQSEMKAIDCCDMMLLLLSPAGGDDLQGLKRGIVEMADIIAINKADGALKDDAHKSFQNYRMALKIMGKSLMDAPPHTKDNSIEKTDAKTGIGLISTLEGLGLETLYSMIDEKSAFLEATKQKQQKRDHQAAIWFDDAMQSALQVYLRKHNDAQKQDDYIKGEVIHKRQMPSLKARQYFHDFILPKLK